MVSAIKGSWIWYEADYHETKLSKLDLTGIISQIITEWKEDYDKVDSMNTMITYH